MKKVLMLCLAIVLVPIIVGTVLMNETVPFPFWQHGSGVTTFWSITNYGCEDPITVSLVLTGSQGQAIQSKTTLLSNGTAWMPDTASWGGGWYTSGDNTGFGLYLIEADADCCYLWAAVYGLLPQGQTGFTIVMPQNPYGGEFIPTPYPTHIPTPTPTIPVVPATTPVSVTILIIGLGIMMVRRAAK